jgi:NADPH-dependent ferric siderophore reductase
VSGEPRVRFLKVDEEIRFRPLHVVGATRITPHMMRVVLGGPEVANFVSRGEDDDIRMQLPLDFSQVPVPPVIETNPWRMVFPDGAPETESRAYTIRRLDHAAGELTIDMVLHGEGLATRWAEQVTPGQVVTMAGPWGSRVIEGQFAHYLFLGDETALPAIGRTIESLPPGSSITVVVDMASLEDAQEWDIADGVTLECRWIVRGPHDRPGRNTLLLDALATIDRPPDPLYIFGAGESSTLREVRRYLVDTWDINRKYTNLAGYWKRPDDEDDWFYPRIEETDE